MVSLVERPLKFYVKQRCSLCGLSVIHSFFKFNNLFKIGQSYEIRMLDNRKMGDMPEITGKLVKVRMIHFDS